MTQTDANGTESLTSMPPSPRAPRSGIALAGVTLAALFVHRTANGESVNDQAQAALLRTVLTHRAQHLVEIVPDADYLRDGARGCRRRHAGGQRR